MYTLKNACASLLAVDTFCDIYFNVPALETEQTLC